VYDLNVDDDHTYNISGYAVHNSGAGSLVVHLLGITKIDPIKYDLFFERFLNEKRLDPPDIDLDFDSKGRYKVEIYLKQKYGEHAVSHVISFGTFRIKNSIRDTFRVYFGQDKKESVDVLSKCLEDDDDNFDEALKKMIALEGEHAEKFIEKHKKQFDIARILVGKNRHYSMHAGGIIIAPDHLEKFIPIMRIKDQITTGYPEGGDTRLMTDAGLMKFDILGLNACTIINDALRQLKGKITIQEIIDNDSDPEVLRQFNLANTFSIFQFEGRNISKFVKRAKPSKFVDLVAINALYRPAVIQAGGLEMYLKNKDNYDYEKAAKDPFENILSDTFGIMVFQETSMKIFRELGGFTLAEADETRHVFKLLFKGKTDYTEFNHMMAKFKEGCHKTTDYNDKKIEEIMEVIKSFSKYSFNKAHSAAYAMMAYIMMYLRTYHPAQYFSSLLSNTENSEAMQDGKKINLFQHYVTEIQKTYGIKVVKPDVNESGATVFRIKDDKSLLYALGHIKDVGEKAAINIEQNQPYKSFKDFLERVTRRVVNKRVIKALIYSEALRFDDTAEVFEKETGEKIDHNIFLQKQFDYTGLVASKDLKQATNKEYTLKAVEKAVNEGKFLDKDQAIPVIVFVSKFRRLAGNSKKTGRPYVMYFATLYDGTTKIDDCILNEAEELKIVEGDLLSGKLHFEEAKNKKYSEHTYYLSKISKIKTTEKYDSLGKFNIITDKVQPVVETVEQPKFISRKRKIVEEKVVEVAEQPKFISRKKKVEVVEVPIKMISRKQRTI
jgi:DNA-directed DNA polymerase III PolC